jgi:hypothetical protein
LPEAHGLQQQNEACWSWDPAAFASVCCHDGGLIVRWLAGENLNNDIMRGLLRRKPDPNIVRVQHASLSGVDIPALLA